MTKADVKPALVLKRRFAAPARRIFAAWTNPDTMRKWLTPGPCIVKDVSNDLRLGGSFRIVSEAPDGARHIITGCYIRIEEDRHLEMTWLYTGPIAFLDGIETHLEIDLSAVENDTTEMTLSQTRLPTTLACDAFEADWPSCFDKLATTLGEPLH